MLGISAVVERSRARRRQQRVVSERDVMADEIRDMVDKRNLLLEQLNYADGSAYDGLCYELKGLDLRYQNHMSLYKQCSMVQA